MKRKLPLMLSLLLSLALTVALSAGCAKSTVDTPDTGDDTAIATAALQDSDTGAETTDAGSDADVSADTDVAADEGSDTGSGSGTDVAADAGSDAGSGSGTDVAAAAGSDTGFGSDSDAASDSNEGVEEVTTVTYPEASTLKELFEMRGMKVGTCLTSRMTNDDDIAALIAEQFTSITMENSMKPEAIFSQSASQAAGDLIVQFPTDALNLLAWAQANGMAVRGHTIVWYSQTPEWIFREGFEKDGALVSREVMLSRLESATRQIFETLDELGYSDLFYAYDIVNEYWMEDGTMRSNNWTATIGEDYVWYALYYARQYAPESIDLYINDYNEQYKYDTVYDFINTLVDEDGNYLLDGIGLQAHLYTSDSLTTYFKAVDKLASTGLKLEITELDVSLGSWTNTLSATEANLQKQGRYYYELFNGLFERIDAGTLQMDSITLWGVCDNLSWRKSASPLLFDRNLDPKYAYYGALQIKDKAGYTD